MHPLHVRHAWLTTRHQATLQRLRKARDPGAVVGGDTGPRKTPRTSPLLPPVPTDSSPSLRDRLCLGMDVAETDSLPCVQAAPPGLNLGDYIGECRVCGDDQYLLTGGLCPSCDNYQRRYGVPRPKRLHPPPVGFCVVCGEETRLASHRGACRDCHREEQSRMNRDAERRCAGCGRREKRFRTTGWTNAFDGKGGWVS